MKKLILSICVLAMVLGFTTMATADSISVGDEIYYQRLITNNTNGGPFQVRAYPSGDLLFLTFCLERNEYITKPMIVESISSDAVQGGVGGPEPDPMDDLTAFLYTQYRAGVSFDVDALQVAIWKIEEEILTTHAYWATYGVIAQGYIDDAQDAIDSGWENKHVQVINPVYYDANNEKIDGQSSLTLVPEPAMMLLLGLGLLGLGITSRKFKR